MSLFLHYWPLTSCKISEKLMSSLWDIWRRRHGPTKAITRDHFGKPRVQNRYLSSGILYAISIDQGVSLSMFLKDCTSGVYKIDKWLIQPLYMSWVSKTPTVDRSNVKKDLQIYLHQQLSAITPIAWSLHKKLDATTNHKKVENIWYHQKSLCTNSRILQRLNF